MEPLTGLRVGASLLIFGEVFGLATQAYATAPAFVSFILFAGVPAVLGGGVALRAAIALGERR